MHAQKPEYGTRALFDEAEQFLRQCYTELDRHEDLDDRIEEVWHAIGKRGHYEHTPAELEHGARMAWRNSNRCIGRHFWDSLQVLDHRDVDTAEDVFDALCHHIEYATNGGNIRPTVSVFPPEIRGERQVRIWNYQLIRYAGYQTEMGVVGDPDSLALTEYCQSRGWEGEGTDFDVLPLVIQIGDTKPELFEVPDDIVLEVPLVHPEYDWFGDLGLQWYAVPIVSNMRLEIGGIHYTAAPFNGWYMGTEIGARNLTDGDRYDVLPAVGERLGLDTDADRSLWKDRALTEVNRAVIHSYDECGVRIVDHHTATDQFQQFEQAEADVGREVTGEWSWLVPPSAPATTHVFHSSYDDTVKRPNFFYRDRPY
jgi:nitric-oxide synthase